MRLASKGRTAVRRVLALRPHCAHPILQTLPSGAQKRAEHRNVGRVFLPTASAFNGKREILAQQPMSCDASLWGTLPDGFEHAVHPSDLHPVSHIRLKRGCSQFLCAQVMSDLHVQALLLGLHHDEHVNPARRTPETENEH